MNYSGEDLYWKRVMALYNVFQRAEDTDFKRLWQDKLHELMKLQSKYLTKDLNGVIIA